MAWCSVTSYLTAGRSNTWRFCATYAEPISHPHTPVSYTHLFEQLGWPESTVVIRFWIISIVLALLGLATLKLR